MIEWKNTKDAKFVDTEKETKKRYKEILKLKGMLEKAKIPFEFSELFGGYHITYPINKFRICSVIEHDRSYGSEQDLLEIKGLLTKNEKKFSHSIFCVSFNVRFMYRRAFCT